MPISLDPSNQFSLSLESDKHVPEDHRPTFSFKYSTGREWMKIADLADSIQKGGTGRDALERIFATLRIPLRSWSNMTTTDPAIAAEFGVTIKDKKPATLPYKPELLDLILGPGEAQELLEGVMETIRPNEDELKNSASPTASVPA